MLVSAPVTRQRSKLALAAVLLAALIVSWSYVSCFSAVAFTYLYWLRPELHYAWPEAGGGAARASEAAAAAGGGTPVPRIIHQTWKTKDVPQEWRAAQQSCIDLHPDFEYRLWTDADALKFIQDEYPWFLPTYLAYPYAIQRVDVVRYFILHKLGGIYIDLDMGCHKRLDFLLKHNFTAPLTHPVGISNDIMGARPGDAYVGAALRNLQHWNKWMAIKYIQVMFSTGPMYLTVQYSLFPNKADVAVIPPSVYGKYDSSGDPALYHLHGSSWHASDAHFFLWVDQHRAVLLAVLGLAGAGLLAWAWLRCMARLRLMRSGSYKSTE